MNEIPTAEEIFKECTGNSINQEEYSAMIEFAKLHVKTALEAAANNATITNDYGSGGELFDCVDKESILKSYPENLIK